MRIYAIILAGVFLIFAMVIGGMQAATMTYMRGSYGGGGGGGLPNSSVNQGLGPTGERDADTSAIGFAQDGLTFGTGSSFNYLALLDICQRGASTPDQMYYYNLIEVYIDQFQGKTNDYAYRATPSFLAAMHKNESEWGFYVKEFIGQPALGGQMVTLQNVTEEVVAQLIPDYKSKVSSGTNDPVWVDKNGKDGYPDGPFQVEIGGPDKGSADFGTPNSLISKTSKKTTFDTYSMMDQMNVAAKAYDNQFSRFANVSVPVSTAVKTMFAGGAHNRGSFIRQMYGIAYEPDNVVLKPSTYLTDVNEDSEVNLPALLYAPQTLERIFTSHNLPLDAIYTENRGAASALAWVCFLKDGWLLEEAPVEFFINGIDKLYGLGAQNPIIKLFPEWTTAEIAKSEIASKHVKPLYSTLGISASECDAAYGTIGGMYIERVIESQGGRGSYAFIYKDMGTTSSNYKKAGTRHVQSLDMVAAVYWVQIGLMHESALVELALKAGAPDKIDNQIIDPSNPKVFYTSGTSNSYNPMYGDLGDKLKFILDALGEQYNEVQFALLIDAYQETGLPYVYGGGGRIGAKSATDCGSSGSGTTSLKTWYFSGQDHEGRRAYDCSAHASIIYSGGLENYGYVGSTGTWTGLVKGETGRKISVQSREIDGTLMIVKKDGTTTTGSERPTQSQPKWAASGVAHPADMLCTNGSGHASIWLGTNRTSETVSIPSEYTGAGYGAITIPPGSGLTINDGGGWDSAYGGCYKRSGVELADDTRGFLLFRLRGAE